MTASPMKRAQGFTLIEVVLAIALLAAMMAMAWSGLSFALRGWDTGESKSRRTSDIQLSTNFLRREFAEIFPMRWKDPTTLKFAFEGDAKHLAFVSTRAPGLSSGGLALVSLDVESGGPNRKDLVMRRAMPDEAAKDFGPAKAAEGTILIPDVEVVQFAYFGAENDFVEPRWMDDWKLPARMPQYVRVTVRTGDGTVLPELVAKVMLGEEAGCIENSFQRNCFPRAR
ncbi:hypothetical protein BWI17_08020 [Betaproteobacteria bacterium GR16-43]|nr:hypothetical protein BWI17_08020 [Betaproteobacteria bacterium GR16-43]